jgi:ADP-heptose:LPS heptosyltransferase
MNAAPQKLVLRNSLSPGDILMLTAAVRDLHQDFRGAFQTDVRTSCRELWDHNPYLTPLDENDPDAYVIDCHYPLIHSCNSQPRHFVEGFIAYLGEVLDVDIQLTAFKGDVHLSEEEKARPSAVAELTVLDAPYWIIAAGGKYDYTIKWWHFRRYQEVVDRLRDRVLFVQVGEPGHFHPPLDGVLDMRGKTSPRDLMRLMYHAQGVLCGVTFLMHLAAAVETKNGANRPCVVVAGGREAPHWEAYPGHQFMHTIGALPCCAQGGCWRSRTLPLGDGDEKDSPDSLCMDVVNDLPRCMDMIVPEDVVRRIELYLAGGMCGALTRKEADGVRPFTRRPLRELLNLEAAS